MWQQRIKYHSCQDMDTRCSAWSWHFTDWAATTLKLIKYMEGALFDKLYLHPFPSTARWLTRRDCTSICSCTMVSSLSLSLSVSCSTSCLCCTDNRRCRSAAKPCSFVFSSSYETSYILIIDSFNILVYITMLFNYWLIKHWIHKL